MSSVNEDNTFSGISFAVRSLDPLSSLIQSDHPLQTNQQRDRWRVLATTRGTIHGELRGGHGLRRSKADELAGWLAVMIDRAGIISDLVA